MKKFVSAGCHLNICYNKNRLLFQFVAMNTNWEQSLKVVPRNQLKSENIET